MFCTNCGKEIAQNAKFCLECGAPVNKELESTGGRQEEKGASPELGIYTTGDFKLLREMTEKAGKSKKRFDKIIGILSVVYLFFIIRGLLDTLQSVLEGKSDVVSFALGILAVIFFTFALLHTVWEIIFPILQQKKAVHAEEYLKYIIVNDRKALMHTLGQMKCSAVKSAYMDENGMVCAEGKKSIHMFTVQADGTVVVSSQKTNYKAVLERETITSCLLKFLNPEAPINAYASEKSNKRFAKMRLLFTAAVIISGGIFAIIAIIYGTGNLYVATVKNGSPELYPNITYGEAFESFFGNCEWTYFKSTDRKDVVEFHGNCMYDNKKATVLIQFLVYENKETFEIYAVAIDGKEQPALVYSLLLLDVFESYKGNGEKGKLKSESEDYLSDNNDSATYTEYDNFEDWWDTGLEDTVTWERISGMAGRWSDGTIELSISIYSDANVYSSYDEVGTCFYGEILGSLYFIESDGSSQYLMCTLAQGDEVILQYWGGNEMRVVEASEGLRSAKGVTLYCEEHYES